MTLKGANYSDTFELQSINIHQRALEALKLNISGFLEKTSIRKLPELWKQVFFSYAMRRLKLLETMSPTHSVFSLVTYHFCRFHLSIDVFEPTLLCEMRPTLSAISSIVPLCQTEKQHSEVFKKKKKHHQHEPVINSFTAWAVMLLLFLRAGFSLVQNNTG